MECRPSKRKKSEDGEEEEPEFRHMTSRHYHRLFTMLTPEEVRDTLSADDAKELERAGVSFRQNATDEGLRQSESAVLDEVKTLFLMPIFYV